MEDNQKSIFEGLSITPTLRDTMFTVATWARICAIVSFVSQGISLIAAFKTNSYIIQIIITIFMVFINILLLNFANKLLDALNTGDEGLLTESFSNLRRYFLICGILMFVIIGLVAISILFGVLTGALSKF